MFSDGMGPGADDFFHWQRQKDNAEMRTNMASEIGRLTSLTQQQAREIEELRRALAIHAPQYARPRGPF